MSQLIKASAVKKLAKSQGGKRVSKDFLEALDRYVCVKILSACSEHNGGKKTLDSGLAHYILGIK
jgi:histone H3/H4